MRFKHCEIARTESRASSHDWHVQPVVKDRSAFRLSGAFSTEWKPATSAASVLELCFQPLPSAGSGQSQTFQTYREFPQPVNPTGRQFCELAVENWVPATGARSTF